MGKKRQKENNKTAYSDEARFHDEIADNTRVDRDLAEYLYKFDSPSSYIANRLPRLKKTLLENLKKVSGKRVLVYGCGIDNAAIWFAKTGADVTAIDISAKSIEIQKSITQMLKLNIEFSVMDANSLDFQSESFDLVYGNAILHHLDIDRSSSEVYRVLKPQGCAVFRDVLAGNIFLRLFRALTPFWRTSDEHPLKECDIELIGEKFDTYQSCQYVFTGLPYLFFARMINNLVLKKLNIKFKLPVDKAYSGFDIVDQAIFKLIPKLKNQAWLCLIITNK